MPQRQRSGRIEDLQTVRIADTTDKEIQQHRQEQYNLGKRSKFAKSKLRSTNADFHIDIAEQLKYERHIRKDKRATKAFLTKFRKSDDIVGKQPIPKRAKGQASSKVKLSLLDNFK